MNHLQVFYGTECPHCERMYELLAKLKKEKGIEVEMIEVWHNKENEKRLIDIDKDRCGGVPFLYNTKTDKFICGEVEYNELIAWAEGK